MYFFLISTDHLETKLWFCDDGDYASAMNFVAITAFRTNVAVVAFILMSNHVHFILECTRDKALAFTRFFKEMYSLYRRKRYGDSCFLKGNSIDIQDLPPENESLERAIAYVQCNSVVARLCVHPSGYPWGTGPTFFNASPPSGQHVSTFSARTLAKKLHSRLPVHPDWLLGEGGYILPQAYVPVRFVEKLFRTPTRYQFFLDNSSKARKIREQVAPSFSDQLITTASLNLCRSLFRSNSIGELSPSQTAELVRQLRSRFSSDPAQISRVTGIPFPDVAQILESFY